MNTVISFMWLPTHATPFIVIAKKPVVSVLLKKKKPIVQIWQFTFYKQWFR